MAWGGAQGVGRTVVGTWTYSGNPATSTNDTVRWLLGDTDKDDPLVSDEEIAAAYTDEGSNARRAAAQCCEHLARYFAREADKSVDDVRTALSQRSSAFAKLGEHLRTRSAALATPWAGGISVADKDARESDTDRIAPAFAREQWENIA